MKNSTRSLALSALPALLFGLLVPLPWGWPAGAQQSAPAQEPRPTEASGQASAGDTLVFDNVDVNVVNVEVFVTDKDGAPVTGLTKEDFELLEDGRPVTVSNFYAVDGSGPGGRPRAAQDPDPEAANPEAGDPDAPRPPQVLEPLEVPEDQRLHVVVYFDNLHLGTFSRNRAGREVRRFLRQSLEPEDRVMLVTFERSVHVRQGFTRNLAAVERALAELETQTSFAGQKETERTQVIRRMDSSRTLGEAASHVDFFAKAAYRDAELAIDGLKAVVSSLSGIPGRKALLYVSDGLPMEAGHDLFLMLDQKYGDASAGQLSSAQYSVRSDLRELVAQANSNRVTFYTLEAAGLRSHGSISAEAGGLQDGGSRLDADFARDFNQQETLQLMAAGTGGLATFGTNNLAGGLDRMEQDLRTYYSLGYSPSHSGDGRYYRVEVRLKGPKARGVEVRHRQGYRDKLPETRLSDQALASLLHGVGENHYGIEVQLGQGEAREDGYLLVPIEVRIPIGAVTLVPTEGQNIGRLRVALAVADGEQGTSPPHLEAFSLAIPDEDLEMARDKHYVYAVQLLMRKGRQEVAVGLLDELSGEVSFLRRTVSISG